MGKATKDILKKILSTQEMILAHLNLESPARPVTTPVIRKLKPATKKKKATKGKK